MDFSQPVEVPNSFLSRHALELMPTWSAIPDSFKRSSNPWCQLAHRWFFDGLEGTFVPKTGIDLDRAMRQLKLILGSWSPAHEHKEAAVAYLMSLWFERFESTAAVRA